MIDEKVLIERLEEERKEYQKNWDEFGNEDSFGGIHATKKAIEIVNQLAEEQNEKLMLRNCVDGQEIEPYGRPRVYMGMEDLIELEAYRDLGTLHQIRVVIDRYHELNDSYHQLIKGEHNNGWIPCSERLPKQNGEYITTIKHKTKSKVLNFDTFDNTWYDDELYLYDVIAWQSLPEMYKEV